MADTLAVARRVLQFFDDSPIDLLDDSDEAVALQFQRQDLRDFLGQYDDFQLARTFSEGDDDSLEMIEVNIPLFFDSDHH